MEYPLKLELNITQDDYIEVEILEQELDRQILKKSFKKTFIIETALTLAVALLAAGFVIKGAIAKETLFLIAFVWLFFLFHFVYNYFWGVQREFNMAVQHILKNKDSHEFFTPERGMAYFYENRCEFLTNEQRRYFDYDKIKHIKVIRHLYIFVMKRSREKNMRGFAYMVIPKRCLYRDEQAELDMICEDIIKKYDLKPWVDSDILG